MNTKNTVHTFTFTNETLECLVKMIDFYSKNANSGDVEDFEVYKLFRD